MSTDLVKSSASASVSGEHDNESDSIGIQSKDSSNGLLSRVLNSVYTHLPSIIQPPSIKQLTKHIKQLTHENHELKTHLYHIKRTSLEKQQHIQHQLQILASLNASSSSSIDANNTYASSYLTSGLNISNHGIDESHINLHTGVKLIDTTYSVGKQIVSKFPLGTTIVQTTETTLYTIQRILPKPLQLLSIDEIPEQSILDTPRNHINNNSIIDGSYYAEGENDVNVSSDDMQQYREIQNKLTSVAKQLQFENHNASADSLQNQRHASSQSNHQRQLSSSTSTNQLNALLKIQTSIVEQMKSENTSLKNSVQEKDYELQQLRLQLQQQRQQLRLQQQQLLNSSNNNSGSEQGFSLSSVTGTGQGIHQQKDSITSSERRPRRNQSVTEDTLDLSLLPISRHASNSINSSRISDRFNSPHSTPRK